MWFFLSLMLNWWGCHLDIDMARIKGELNMIEFSYLCFYLYQDGGEKMLMPLHLLASHFVLQKKIEPNPSFLGILYYIPFQHLVLAICHLWRAKLGIISNIWHTKNRYATESLSTTWVYLYFMLSPSRCVCNLSQLYCEVKVEDHRALIMKTNYQIMYLLGMYQGRHVSGRIFLQNTW